MRAEMKYCSGPWRDLRVCASMARRTQKLTTIHRGWLSLRMATIRLDDDTFSDREIVDHPSGATVLLYNPDKRTALLITELRPPVEWVNEPRMLEAVAGKLDESDPEGCARREAEEEAGVRIAAMEHVARLWMTPASSTERVYYYLASYSEADRVSQGGGAEGEHENIRVREVALAELLHMAEAGEIRDAKTFLLLQALQLRRPDLFVA
jgi:nudix-type nucleoside diphosphatase (YffH/AdpP family)